MPERRGRLPGPDGLRVLYVIDSLAPGGAERSLADLAPHYTAAGMGLDVAYMHERQGLNEELREAGAHLHHLGPGGRTRWARSAVDLIRELQPDIVHTTLFEADVAGRVAAAVTRTPVVSSLVNVWYGSDQARAARLPLWKVRAAQAVDAATARAVTRFHAVSDWVAETMARRLLIRRRRIDVVPRGRDEGMLGERTAARRQWSRRSLGVSDDDVVVLAVARQEPQKGLDVLLRALALLTDGGPGPVTVIAGREGTHSERLRQLAVELGVESRVRWLGERRDVPDLLCAADTFVLPSRWEGFPGSVLEALAMSVPIVASALPCVAEAVGDCAVLVPPGDHVALAKALSLEGSAATARVAAGRRRFLERFTTERVAEQMITFYQRALGSEATGRQT